MYCNAKKVTLTGGIPFAVALPKAPESIDADRMSATQIREKLNEGLSDIESGKARPAREIFEQFRAKHSDEGIMIKAKSRTGRVI